MLKILRFAQDDRHHSDAIKICYPAMYGPQTARICKDSRFYYTPYLSDTYSPSKTTGTVSLVLLGSPSNVPGSHAGDLLTALTAASFRSGFDPKIA